MTLKKPYSTMEWLVDKIERKLTMFLKTKDVDYLDKVDSITQDLRNELDLEQSWEEYYQEWVKK